MAAQGVVVELALFVLAVGQLGRRVERADDPGDDLRLGERSAAKLEVEKNLGVGIAGRQPPGHHQGQLGLAHPAHAANAADQGRVSIAAQVGEQGLDIWPAPGEVGHGSAQLVQALGENTLLQEGKGFAGQGHDLHVAGENIAGAAADSHGALSAGYDQAAFAPGLVKQSKVVGASLVTIQPFEGL